MANYEIPEKPEYDENIRKLEPSDPAHADLFNTILGRIIRNVAFLKRDSVSRGDLGIPEGEASSVESQVPVIPAPAANRENIADGDNMGTILSKIRQWFADLKTVAFSGSYNDLSNKPSIPSIPGSLKNPHPWKANGKTYDGSSEQDMGTLGIGYGGTGATTAAEARTALGLGEAAVNGVANNDTTTAAGYLADARIVKTHGDEIDQINSDLTDGGKITGYEVREGDGVYITYLDGADSVTKKLGNNQPIKLGTIDNGSTLSVSLAQYSSYHELTEKNIVVDVISITIGVSSNGTNKYPPGGTFSSGKSIKYDADTGQLTVTVPKIYRTSYAGNGGSTSADPAITQGQIRADVYLIL